MLRLLRIRNLAVIEAAEVEFASGFNVLTGETGAGKSILIEAVGLLLGGRASADLVRTGAPAAVVEAILDAPDGSDLIVRREISSQGRSRATINGDLATAAQLRDVVGPLVDLHGQHEHQGLMDPATHLSLLDGFGDLERMAEPVAAAWTALRSARQRLEQASMDRRERTARLDLVEFQLQEIGRVGPQPGEDEELAALRTVLASAERVQRLCTEGYEALYEREGAVLEGLGQVWKRVAELSELTPEFTPYLEARAGIKSQLEDLATALRRYGDGIDASPERLQATEGRLAGLEGLKRKYGPTLDDVLRRQAALEQEREQLTDPGADAQALAQLVADAERHFLGVSELLSSARAQAAPAFGAAMQSALQDLAMGRVHFEFRFEPLRGQPARWSERGIDAGEIFISLNPGEAPKPLARVASGGELSRIMLALKTLRLEAASPHTMIFDEVDAGIGGRVADVVGGRLRELGTRAQVLCITHLPQIAARAQLQFRIEKATAGGRTTTTVSRLDEAGRVGEIARMLGGDTMTEAVLTSARDLIGHAKAKRKQTPKGESESPTRG
ncbi:MAG: DNA repair protein RecN [Acidobacteria bacterium]|nr:DNA repair protein RecN [Acidobacteriota bacterium]